MKKRILIENRSLLGSGYIISGTVIDDATPNWVALRDALIKAAKWEGMDVEIHMDDCDEAIRIEDVDEQTYKNCDQLLYRNAGFDSEECGTIEALDASLDAPEYGYRWDIIWVEV